MKICKYCGKEVAKSRAGMICKNCDKKKSVLKGWRFTYKTTNCKNQGGESV